METTEETTPEFTNETNTRAIKALADLADVLERTRNAVNDGDVIREAIKAQVHFDPKADSVPRGHNGNMAVIQQTNSVLTTSYEILTDQALNFRTRFANLVARGDEKAANDFLENVEDAILDAKKLLKNR
jgi:hypothetical protein